VVGNDPHGGHGYVCEGDTAPVGVRRVSHGMVEVKLFCFRWLSPFLKLPAYEDGTERVFRNVGIYNSDAREITHKKAYKIKNDNK
jgi:hypothetical protein